MQREKEQSGSRFLWRNIRTRILRAQPKPFSSILRDWQFLVVLVILLFFTNWLGKRWVFEPATLGSTDILLRERKPALAKHCTLITFDEKEFDTYLGEWLQPKKLADVLATIMEYKPKVIVVDIDTSASRFRDLVIPADDSVTRADNSKIVWARVSQEMLKTNPHTGTRSLVWEAGKVLGGRADQPEFSGTPLFPQDSDATVRSFQRIVTIDAHAPSLYWVSLHALSQSGAAYADVPLKNDDTKDDQQLRPFLTDWYFPTITLTDLMSPGGSARPQANALGDVVVLGANFSDIHPTSFGLKLGVELTAAALESELAPKEGPWLIFGGSHWILKIVLAFAIAGLNNRLLPLWATTGTLLLIGLVFTASFLGIYYGVFRMDSLPFMIGIWIEQLIEISQRAHHTAQ